LFPNRRDPGDFLERSVNALSTGTGLDMKEVRIGVGERF
jgi:hypothetical protein